MHTNHQKSMVVYKYFYKYVFKVSCFFKWRIVLDTMQVGDYPERDPFEDEEI